MAIHEGFCNDITRARRVWNGAFRWDVSQIANCRSQLGRAENVWKEGVVIKAPDPVGTSWLEGVGLDERSY